MNSVRLMNTLALLAATCAGLVVAGGALVWLAQRPYFSLRAIEVRGELQHVTSASVRAAVAGRLKGNYLTMRLDDTRRLLEGVPWVARASVRRVWPNRLLVTLVEHRALGVWDDGRLLSDQGELFVANPAEAEVHGPLPAFQGPVSAARDAARRYYEFAAQLAPLGMSIAAVDVSARRSWSLQVEAADGAPTRLELGRETDAMALNYRMAQIVAAYPMVAARVGGTPQSIDARYPNGLAASPPAKSR
ncbi:MAG: FtsQ-type POTRA domain-containing protein [Burkholderiaceae bacterium]|jgi:cell division protein FtsQ|nr:FtsQ-type POTRA domain-containing protein [Burkholderiaceae bacterium]